MTMFSSQQQEQELITNVRSAKNLSSPDCWGPEYHISDQKLELKNSPSPVSYFEKLCNVVAMYINGIHSAASCHLKRDLVQILSWDFLWIWTAYTNVLFLKQKCKSQTWTFQKRKYYSVAMTTRATMAQVYMLGTVFTFLCNIARLLPRTNSTTPQPAVQYNHLQFLPLK